jgi:hypothetical protein
VFPDIPASQHHTNKSPEEDLGGSVTDLDSPELSESRNLVSSGSEWSPLTVPMSGGFYEAAKTNLLIPAVDELSLFNNTSHLH